MKSDMLTTVLPEDLLLRCRERATEYDRENRFFQKDFDELRELGYLTVAVPKELGGKGLSLAEVGLLQRRLATFAPATALAINMHLYWSGLCADLWRAGDRSLEWLLRETAAGEVFAAGHAEKGNDVPVLYSSTSAERVEGGYRFNGHKSFGSLGTAWTRLGFHGIDTSDPEAPKIVHAFAPRETSGMTIENRWDTLGMRATQSDDTILEDVFVPDEYIARVVPAGAAGLDPFVLGVFGWALMGFSNVYFGIAKRALELTLESVSKKTSLAVTRTLAYHPEIQHSIAEMVLELEGIEPHLDSVARDWADRVDHGPLWPSKIVACKFRTVEGAWKVVDTALEVIGGFGIYKASEIERLVRDARLGRIHPANRFLTHEIVAKTALGIDLDEAPRWG